MELSKLALTGRTETVKKKLIDALNGWTPFWAAHALLEGWDGNDHEIVGALRKKVGQPSREASEIAQFIPRIIKNPLEAKRRLFELLIDPDCKRPDFVIQGLATLVTDIDREEIVTESLAKLTSRSDWIREPLLSAIIVAFPSDPRVRDLAMSEVTKREPPLYAVATAFANDAEIRDLVAQLLAPLPVDLRRQIVNELKGSEDRSLALEILRNWDTERDADIKTLASIGYHEHLLNSHEDTTEADKYLEECIPCYGPDYEARRQAAFPGMLMLKKLNLLSSRKETIGATGQDIVIPFERGTNPNLVLVEFIGRNWDEVKSLLGEDLASKFTRPVDPNLFWKTMCLVGAQESSLRGELKLVLSSNESIAKTAPALSFLAKIEPGSARLRSLCFSAIRDQESISHGWFDQAETAAFILADQFRQHDSVRDELLQSLNSHQFLTGMVIALCLGWPELSPLEDLYRDIEGTFPSLRHGAWVDYLFYAKSPVDRLLTGLQKNLGAAAIDVYDPRFFLKPLFARLRRDEESVNEIFQVLSESSDPVVKTSFPRILAETSGVTPALAQWCLAELRRQRQVLPLEVGYDVILPGHRPIASSLLDVLDRA
jgi:hypothetical protein